MGRFNFRVVLPAPVSHPRGFAYWTVSMIVVVWLT